MVMIRNSVQRSKTWLWRLAAVLGLVTPIAIAAAVSWLPTPLFQSSAWILLETSKAPLAIVSQGDERQTNQPFLTHDQTVKSQLMIAISEGVIRNAIDSYSIPRLYPALSESRPENWYSIARRYLGLNEDSPNAPEKATKRSTPEDQAFRIARANMTAAVEPNTYIIRISFRHEDPEIAAGFANELVAKFMERRAQIYANPTATSFFTQLQAQYNSDVRKAYEALEKFTRSTGTYSVSEQRSLALARRDSATAALSATRGQISRAESAIESLRTQLTSVRGRMTLPPEIYGPTTPSSQDPKTAKSSDTFAADPPLLQIKLYQDMAQNLVASNAELAGLRSQEGQQLRDLLQIESQLQRIANIEAEFNNLKRAISDGERYLESFTRKAADAEINDAWRSNESSTGAQILQSATVADGPAFPNPKLFMGLGIITGLFLFGAIIFFSRVHAKTVESAADLKDVEPRSETSIKIVRS